MIYCAIGFVFGLVLIWPGLALTLAALLRVHGRGVRRAAKIYGITWRHSELSRKPIDQKKEARHAASKAAFAAARTQ